MIVLGAYSVEQWTLWVMLLVAKGLRIRLPRRAKEQPRILVHSLVNNSNKDHNREHSTSNNDHNHLDNTLPMGISSHLINHIMELDRVDPLLIITISMSRLVVDRDQPQYLVPRLLLHDPQHHHRQYPLSMHC